MAEKNLTLKFGATGMPGVLSQFGQLRQTAMATNRAFTVLNRTNRALASAGVISATAGQFNLLSQSAMAATGAIQGVAMAMNSLRTARAGLIGIGVMGIAATAAAGVDAFKAKRQADEAERALADSLHRRGQILVKAISTLRDDSKLASNEANGFIQEIDAMLRFGGQSSTDPSGASDRMSSIFRRVHPLMPSEAAFKTKQKMLDLEAEQKRLDIDQVKIRAEESFSLKERNQLINIYLSELQQLIRTRSDAATEAVRQGIFDETDNMELQLELSRDLLNIDRERQQMKAAEIALEEEKQQKLRQLRELQLHGTQQMFADMATAARVFGREGFIAFKAFAIASALVSTYSSAVKAYESTVGIPYVGPFIAPVAAGAAVAAGLANVATISAQTYAQGGYTGNYGTDTIVGGVHGGEYVMSAPAVDRIGLANLEALHSGEQPMGMSVRAVFVWSRDELVDIVANSPANERIIVETMGRNTHKFRS